MLTCTHEGAVGGLGRGFQFLLVAWLVGRSDRGVALDELDEDVNLDAHGVLRVKDASNLVLVGARHTVPRHAVDVLRGDARRPVEEIQVRFVAPEAVRDEGCALCRSEDHVDPGTEIGRAHV